jgi:hypothetical protein
MNQMIVYVFPLQISLYLVLAMHNYVLAALAAGLFVPLIGFHFIVTLISKRDGLVKIEGI